MIDCPMDPTPMRSFSSNIPATNMKIKKLGNINLFNLMAIDLRQNNPNESIILEDVHEFTSIKEIREKLSKLLDSSLDSIQLFHPNNRGIELRDSQTLRDLKIANQSGFIEFAMSSRSPSTVSSLSGNSQCKRISISPANVGTSGVYFVENLEDHVKTAVFKPSDEEQGMVNNPKGYKTKPLKSFFEPGQGMFREFAAYLLDVDNFAKIPRTRLVRLEDESFQYSGTSVFPKTGALQEYVVGGEEICEYGQDVFTDLQIQKIALLDLRLLNCDRNDENVLVVKKSTTDSSTIDSKSNTYDLIPIDHAYCLPAQLQIECWDWFWFNYPQVRKPICPEIIAYFKSLDIDQMINNLCNEVSVSSNCIFLLRLIHHVISQCIDKGLTLYDIASLVARADESIPSPLEKIIVEAESNSYVTIDARSSRLNSHTSTYKVSSSLDSPRILSFVPDEIRERSLSMSESNCDWFYPSQRTINMSTERMRQSDSIPFAGSPNKPPNVYQYQSSDSECDTTDDSSVSTFTDMLSPLECTRMLPSAVIRGVSQDTYMQNYHVSLKESSQSSSQNFRDLSRSTRSRKFQKVDGWDIKLSSKTKIRESFGVEVSGAMERKGDHPTPVFSSILADHISSPINTQESFKRKDSVSTVTTPCDTCSLDSDLSHPSILRRMVSFAAIPSEPMYDLKSTYEEKLTDALQLVAVEPFDIVKGRRVPKKVLQQHVSHDSNEFQSLRQHFAENLVNFSLNKIAQERNPKRI